MANLDSTIRFIIKAEGEQAAVTALAKIEAAAQKAGTSVSKFLKTSAGDSLANNLKLSATAAGQLAAEQDKAANAANRHGKAQDALTASTRRSYFAQTALTTVLSAGINKAFLELVDVTGQAIQRVDLIAQFPDAMAALGLSAKDASESLATLSTYIGAIGGNLQEASTSVTRFAEITGNVKAATAEFVGINNALIAGAAPAQVQKNALEQLTQAYSRGVPQLIEWRSLLIAMPAQLSAVAKAMGFSNAGALGEALTNGKVSMQDFVTELTKLSTGTGEIAKQALVRMNGIQFAFNVFKNTLVEGVTAIIQTVGRENIVNFFSLLTGVVQQLAIWAVRLISILFSLFNVISRVFGGPQLKLASDNTGAIADNLATGAEGAGDLADGLDDASKAAKKTAGQLAAFDKMNVLTSPSDSADSGKDKGTAKGPAALDPATAKELEGIFDGIGGKIGEISTASKILAGILASIAGIKLAQGLFNQFNGLIKTIDETAKNLDRIANKIVGVKDEDKKGGFFTNAVKSLKDFSEGLGNLGVAIAAVFSNSKIVQAIAKFGKLLIGPVLAAIGIISGAIETLVLTVAVGLGVSVGAAVAIIVAIVVAIAAVIFLVVKYWDQIWEAIKIGALAFKDFMVALWQSIVDGVTTVWNALYDIFAGPVKFILQFVDATITLIIVIIAVFVQAVVGLFVLLVQGIYNILKAVSGWIYDNVIQPVVNFFIALWNKIVDLAKFAWNFIFVNVLGPIGGWINLNVIQPVVNLFKLLWDTVSGFVSAFYNNLVNFLSPVVGWIYNNIIVPIGNFFAGLWNGIKAGLEFMISGFGTLFGNLVNLVKVPINGIIDVFNNVLKSLNKLKVPDWVPGYGGKSVNFPLIPKLARGGVIDKSMLINAGENGAEAIVPLENNLEWLDKLADKINSTSGGANGQPIYLTVQIGEDKVASKIIDLINEKTQMSGRNAIFV